MESDKRPWGGYAVLFNGPDYKVKRIEVSPGKRFSLQKHFKRAETWVVVSGSGVATLGKNEISVHRGSVIEVAKEETHRMQCTSADPLVLIEVQFGDYLGEDDIVRFEDDFNRS